jgi:transcriptional antiterminator Rof (Rho-off)
MTIVLDDIKTQEFIKDGEYLHTHYNELIRHHNQEYVAIKNQKVEESANTIDELEKLLNKKNIELGTILVEFIRDKRNYM